MSHRWHQGFWLEQLERGGGWPLTEGEAARAADGVEGGRVRTEGFGFGHAGFKIPTGNLSRGVTSQPNPQAKFPSCLVNWGCPFGKHRDIGGMYPTLRLPRKRLARTKTTDNSRYWQVYEKTPVLVHALHLILENN